MIATFGALLLFFIAGGPFGLINDIGNGLIGFGSAALALRLHPQLRSWLAVIAAIAGGILAAWGSWMVIGGMAGFVLAGFVSSIGFGLIGVWLAVIVWSPTSARWSGRSRALAKVAAVLMIAGGALAVPGAVMGIDDYEAMPAWLWLFGLGWAGTYALFPAWALSLGRRFAS